MARQRSIKEEAIAALDRRIRAETLLVPQEIIPYNNYAAVSGGALPIELPDLGLTPDYCVYAVAPSGYRCWIYTEFGLDQLKADKPELGR